MTTKLGRRYVIVPVADHTTTLLNNSVSRDVNTLRKSLDDQSYIYELKSTDIPVVFQSYQIYNHVEIANIINGSTTWTPASPD